MYPFSVFLLNLWLETSLLFERELSLIIGNNAPSVELYHPIGGGREEGLNIFSTSQAWYTDSTIFFKESSLLLQRVGPVVEHI